MERWRAELYHHGIKGQRWGVRNGPPYPLRDGDHSASEKKAGWRKSNGQTSKNQHLNGSSSDTFDSEKAKRIAKNVAIGAAFVVIALGGAYMYSHRQHFSELANRYRTEFLQKREGVKKNRQYQRASEKLERTVKRRGKGDPLEDFGTKRRSYYLSRTSIHELSDKDEIIRAGTQFQRIISAHSAEEGIMSEKIKDVMYAAYEEKDKSIYYHQFGVVKQRVNAKRGDSIQQLAMQMTANKDIKIASDRKRVQTFMDLMQDDSFRDAFRKDRLSFFGKRPSAIAMWNIRTGEFEGQDWSIGNEQRSYRIFQHLLGDETSKSRKMYLDKMVGMGYNAIIDDNDANAFGRSPIILLSASSDVVITGAQVVSEALDMIGLAKLGNIDDFLDGKK